MNELALFPGAGGGILASRLLGWRTICAVEIDPYCREVLLRRQEEGHLEAFPIWDDVRSFDGKPWRGVVDAISFGDPCQDASCAFTGGTHSPSGLPLAEAAIKIVSDVRPTYVLRENPWPIRKRTIWPPDRIVDALGVMGYTGVPVSIRACCLGFDHRRWRMFVPSILANPASLVRRSREEESPDSRQHRSEPANRVEWNPEPDVARVANGVAYGMDRLRALGEGQVPAVARAAWELLTGE